MRYLILLGIILYNTVSFSQGLPFPGIAPPASGSPFCHSVISFDWSTTPQADSTNFEMIKTTTNNFQVGGNLIWGAEGGDYEAARVKATYANDQCAKAINTVNSGSGNDQVAMLVRAQNGADTYYGCRIISLSGVRITDIIKTVAGSSSQLAVASDPADGDELICYVTGSSPAVVNFYDITTSTLLGTASDGMSPLTSGFVGVYAYGAGGGAKIGTMDTGDWF